MNNLPDRFADRLDLAIDKSGSIIVAGFDPVMDQLPDFARKEKGVKNILLNFHLTALESIQGNVAAIKINTAFFEQFALEGIEAMILIAEAAKKAGLLIIADAKRGDIGSTAKAYSKAFLSKDCAFDALTVNPFLGFDTVEVFLEDCVKNGKGIFVLVKTSNPGSNALQDVKDASGRTVSEKVADWLGENAEKLCGKNGNSGLGAVVGATYPEEAIELRKRMPSNFFLIPGYGAQGGSARDALSGLRKDLDGKLSCGIINISRGLFASFDAGVSSSSTLKTAILSRLNKFNQDININR